MKLAILLTATIKVQAVGGNFTVGERVKMYSSTLDYYAKAFGKKYPILYLENSDYDMSEFKEKYSKILDIEFIQFAPKGELPFDQSKGKSFNEYLMIKEGLLRSEVMKRCSHFMKITGRYAMLNINSVIKEIERRASNKVFMGDVKDTKLYELIGSKNYGRWGDSRYWVFDVQYYKDNMLDCYQEMDDSTLGMWAEDYFLKMSRKYRKDDRFIFRFRTQVLFNGITGMRTSADLAAGRYRQDSFSQRVKYVVRSILRRLFPFIWF